MRHRAKVNMRWKRRSAQARDLTEPAPDCANFVARQPLFPWTRAPSMPMWSALKPETPTCLTGHGAKHPRCGLVVASRSSDGNGPIQDRRQSPREVDRGGSSNLGSTTPPLATTRCRQPKSHRESSDLNTRWTAIPVTHEPQSLVAEGHGLRTRGTPINKADCSRCEFVDEDATCAVGCFATGGIRQVTALGLWRT